MSIRKREMSPMNKSTPTSSVHTSESKKSVLFPITIFISDSEGGIDYNDFQDAEVEVSLKVLSELFKQVDIYNLEKENHNG